MPDFVSPLLNFYQAQMTGALKIAGASLSGIDRIEHLSLKTLREATDSQLHLAEHMAERGRVLEHGALPNGEMYPAAERALEFQRELAVSLAELTGALFNAYVAYVQGMNTALAQSASALSWAKAKEGAFSVPASPLAFYEESQKQWQNFAQQMVTTSHTLLERASGEKVNGERAGNGSSKGR